MALASQGGSSSASADGKTTRTGSKPGKKESESAGGYVIDGVHVAGNPANKKLPK